MIQKSIKILKLLATNAELIFVFNAKQNGILNYLVNKQLKMNYQIFYQKNKSENVNNANALLKKMMDAIILLVFIVAINFVDYATVLTPVKNYKLLILLFLR